jgi:hypothetical protein
MAYLTKESAVFAAPVPAIDACARQRRRAALAIGIGLVSVSAAEQMYGLAITGDPLFRPPAPLHHSPQPARYRYPT